MDATDAVRAIHIRYRFGTWKTEKYQNLRELAQTLSVGGTIVEEDVAGVPCISIRSYARLEPVSDVILRSVINPRVDFVSIEDAHSYVGIGKCERRERGHVLRIRGKSILFKTERP